MNDTPTPTNDEWIVTDNENYIEIASTKTLDSIASVHGGKTVGEQYDLAGRIAKVPQLERELTAVTEQRDAANAEFYRYYGLWDRATKQLETVTEQRDRLAEALNKLTQYDLGDIPIGIVRECNEALQSAQSPLVRGCSHDPRTLAGMPIGQYHCPECGEMVIAGLAHDPEPPTKQNG